MVSQGRSGYTVVSPGVVVESPGVRLVQHLSSGKVEVSLGVVSLDEMFLRSVWRRSNIGRDHRVVLNFATAVRCRMLLLAPSVSYTSGLELNPQRERAGHQVTFRPSFSPYRTSAPNPAEGEQLKITEMRFAYSLKALALFFAVSLLAGEWELLYVRKSTESEHSPPRVHMILAALVLAAAVGYLIPGV